MVNRVTPGRVPFLWRNFLPGYTPRAALKLGLIEDWGGLEGTLERARIDLIAQEWNGEGDYSEMLREHLPSFNGSRKVITGPKSIQSLGNHLSLGCEVLAFLAVIFRCVNSILLR